MVNKRDDASLSEEKDSLLFDDELVFADEDDELTFADEADQAQDAEYSRVPPWKVLIVDDEEEVHSVTKLALNDFEFEGRKLDFMSAFSSIEAKKCVEENGDIALILLDVVMETDDAGLKFVENLRQGEQANSMIRIVLRTGQPGYAPEESVIMDYDINDYKAKTELTTQKLFTTVVAALRSYRDLQKLEEQRQEIEDIAVAAARFVPADILRFLQKESIVDVGLGDQTQCEMTVLFSDVRNFTLLSENMTPYESFNFINELLNKFGPIVRQHHGFIDKYIGDSVMALFPNEANHAVKAGIEMQNELKEINDARHEMNQPLVKIGVGIHTGKLILGMIGEKERLEGTVISDVVNTAARMEGLTKRYKSPMLISKQTLEELGQPIEYNYRFMEHVKVKGKTQSTSVYEIYDSEPQEVIKLKNTTKENLDQGISAYYNRQFEKSTEYFRQALSGYPDDRIAEIYLELAEIYEQNGVPDGWNGEIEMTEK
ncbi:TPA: response regulator [Candidatus Poribacteria bacterium]|nr:response regulator [Candidatus Poribacteria bacterium]